MPVPAVGEVGGVVPMAIEDDAPLIVSGPVIEPLDAVMLPVMVALVATKAPASVSQNGAVARFANVFPAQKRTSSPPVTVEANPKELAASLR